MVVLKAHEIFQCGTAMICFAKCRCSFIKLRLARKIQVPTSNGKSIIKIPALDFSDQKEGAEGHLTATSHSA